MGTSTHGSGRRRLEYAIVLLVTALQLSYPCDWSCHMQVHSHDGTVQSVLSSIHCIICCLKELWRRQPAGGSAAETFGGVHTGAVDQ